MKRMLFVGVGYHHYDEYIKAAFERKGYAVDYVCDRPKNFMVCKDLLGDRLFERYMRRYERRLARGIKETDYDLVLVVTGDFLTEEFLEYLRATNKGARFILYLWDNVFWVHNFGAVRKHYDAIYSFDLADCQTYGFDFLPLFYIPEICQAENTDGDSDYVMYSAMVNHSDRYGIVKAVLEKYPDEPMLFYLVIGRKNGLIRKFVKNYKFDYADDRLVYRAKPLGWDENYRLSMRAKAVLDSPSSHQTGLTIRTIEALGSSRKFVTTNKSVKYYDFYNPKNIQIIDADNIDINISLIKDAYEDVPEAVFRKYALDSWAAVLVGQETHSYLGEGYTVSNVKL